MTGEESRGRYDVSKRAAPGDEWCVDARALAEALALRRFAELRRSGFDVRLEPTDPAYVESEADILISILSQLEEAVSRVARYVRACVAGAEDCKPALRVALMNVEAGVKSFEAFFGAAVRPTLPDEQPK